MYTSFTIGSTEFVLVRRYSKIGYCYPILCAKIEGDYVALDTTTSIVYPLKEADWNEYLADATMLADETELEELLSDNHIIYSKLKELYSK